MYKLIPSVLFFVGLFSVPQTVFTQISIPTERFTKLIDKPFREVLYETNLDITPQLQTIIAASGANQTWDFSSLNFVDSTVTESHIFLVDPNDPLLSNPNFAGATHVWRDKFFPHPESIPNDTVYSIRYGNFSGGVWSVRGGQSVGDLDNSGEVDTFTQWFSPPSQQIAFPITENSQWYDSTTINQEFMGMVFTSATNLDSSWVTGWGTLVTPEGSVDALRVYTKSINRVMGIPLDDVSEELSFFSLEGELSASIVIEDGRAFYTRATFDINGTTSVNGPARNSFRFKQVSPNPVQEVAKISFVAQVSGAFTLRLLDLQGRPVSQSAAQFLPVGENTISWERPAGLPAGPYVLELGRNGEQYRRQFIVLR